MLLNLEPTPGFDPRARLKRHGAVVPPPDAAQQIVTPIDGGHQRLLPRQGRPAAASKERETVAQSFLPLVAMILAMSTTVRAMGSAMQKPSLPSLTSGAGSQLRNPGGSTLR